MPLTDWNGPARDSRDGKQFRLVVKVDIRNFRIEYNRPVIVILAVYSALVNDILGGSLQISEDLLPHQVSGHGFPKVFVEGIILEFEELLWRVDPHSIVHSLQRISIVVVIAIIVISSLSLQLQLP